MRLDRSISETAVVVRRFDSPERVLVFDQGRLEQITMGGRAIGKGTYAPGWRWSRCTTGPASPADATAEHVGVVLSGRVKVQRSEEHTSELQSRRDLVCRLLLEK